MNVAEIANCAVQEIIPYFEPLSLIKLVGQNAADEAGRQIGLEGWNRIKRLLARLRQKPSSTFEDALAELLAHPEDTDFQAALRLQIRRLLNQDLKLAGEVAAIVARPNVTTNIGVEIRGRADNSTVFGIGQINR
jgi:hypothetical protein